MAYTVKWHLEPGARYLYNNGMAKPKLPEGEARTELFVIRMTPAEVAHLREAAGVTAPSVWARSLLVGACRRAGHRRQQKRKRSA